MFRNHSINSCKGCSSSPLHHPEGSTSSTEADGSPLWSLLRKDSPRVSSLLALPALHLHSTARRICMQLPALPTPSSCCRLLLWWLLAQHSMAWYGTAWYWAMDAAPCRASHPAPFPLPLPEVAASTSLPESKGKLFLQPYLAGLATNIPRDAKFFLGCSPIIWRGVAAVAPWCQGPCAGSHGDRSLHTPSLAWLQVLILNHKRSLWYLPRQPPSPQGWLLTLPGDQSFRPMVFTLIPTTVVLLYKWLS